MKDRFRAFLITKDDSGQKAELAELGLNDLMEGDVVVAVSHSTVNFKDGLALTGRSPVVRKFPMIGGIDLAGTVETSSNPNFKPGDKVLLNGYGLSETHFGGYSEYARVKGEWLVPLPKQFTPAEAMAIGTAGYTSMLCVLALEDAGITSDKGPIIVTGANGGVGSVAIAILAKLGYRVIASTGRKEEEAYLKSLGASEIIDRAELSGEPKMLAKERWAGAVDSVGSKTLANVIASTQYGGAVAACGLAQGMDLPTSVAPFILRGVSLLGIDSVQMRHARRVQAWERLARDLDVKKLAAMTQTIKLADVKQAANDILAGKVRGRIVVEIAANLVFLIFAGVIIGLIAAAPIGPVNLICIRRTLAYGPLNGFMAGLGAAVGDGIFAAVIGFGVTAVAQWIEGYSLYLQIVGGILLLSFGIHTYVTLPDPSLKEQAKERASEPSSLMRIGVSTFALTMTNPATLFGFAAMFAGLTGLAGGQPTLFQAGIVVAGVFAGSALWWFILTETVGHLHTKIDARVMRIINHSSGVAIALFGVAVLGHVALKFL